MHNDLNTLFLQNNTGERIVDSLPVAIYMTDTEGRLKYYNDSAVKFSGREPKLGTDKWCVSLKLYYTDGRPMPHDECPMAVSLQEERSIDGAEAIAERPDGERIWFKVYPSPLYNKEGELVGGINVLVDITERTKAEQALQESEEKYRTIFETMDEGFCIIKLEFDDNNQPVDFYYLETNPAFEKHGGLTGVEQKSIHEVLPTIDEKWIKRYGNVVLTGEPVQDVLYVESLKRWLDISAYRIGERGEQKVAVLFKDITKRKQAEFKLRKNRDRLLAALGIDTVGVLFWEMESITIKEVNDAFLEMSGYDREEAVGKTWQELTPEKFHPISNQAVDNLKKNGHTKPYEKQYIRKDGSRWWGLFAPRVIDENEIVEFVLDISERKHVEEEREQLLRQVESEREQLSDIFKQAPSFMCVLHGPDHVFERANDYYRQLVGDRELIGKPARKAIPEFEDQGLVGLLDEVYETGEPFRGTDMEIMLQRQPNTEKLEKRFVDFVYQPLRDADGSINGIFVQGVDLTERHHAREELKAINETLEERVQERTEELLSYQSQLRSLASQLSKAEENQRQQLASEIHDNLGQMLALGKMKADLLQNIPDSADSSGAITDLQEVLDDALRYSRELMSELKPPPSIDGDIKAAAEWIAERLEKHGLKVDINDDGRPKPLDEEVRITVLQSIRELLFNVVKHTSEKEAVILLRRSRDQLRVTVKDEGEGFDPDKTEWTPDKNGNFGLFNVQERIDLLGGEVNIEAKRGEGTKVTLSIPLSGKAAAREEEEPEETPEPIHKSKVPQVAREERIKVLLVDDHQMVRKGLRKIIEDQDDVFVAGEAGDGEEAVSLSRETAPDIVLMDVNMPKMDGIEATRRITSEMPGTRIIGLSLHDEKRVIEKMRSAGASAYLTKTEAFESLIVTIRAEASAQGE
ncbi:PAS domain S-box protein [Fodinibius sp.]|uniref:PAS domain S-box protein n=1 Tax=Fodinibius sp. TaxID=1872440 RepID=UPI0035668EC9